MWSTNYESLCTAIINLDLVVWSAEQFARSAVLEINDDDRSAYLFYTNVYIASKKLYKRQAITYDTVLYYTVS